MMNEITLKVKFYWQVKEWRNGLWVVVREFENLITNYGLTAFSGASPATYLVIDTSNTTLAGNVNPGDMVVNLSADPTVAGDTQLVLSVGQAGQETVTFSSKSGTNPYAFALSSPAVNAHAFGDFVVRAPTAADTLASVLSEAQFDPTYFPNQRVPLTATYSPNQGQTTYQFFVAGIQATNLYFAHVGLADNVNIGQGNLHNYAALGYNHNNVNDFEIDATYTITGS